MDRVHEGVHGLGVNVLYTSIFQQKYMNASKCFCIVRRKPYWEAMLLLVFYYFVCSQDASGGGGALKESLSRDVEMYHRGLQTLQPCLFILLPMLKKGDVLYNPFLSCFTQEIKCFFN